jgi:hypothetical protein
MAITTSSSISVNPRGRFLLPVMVYLQCGKEAPEHGN